MYKKKIHTAFNLNTTYPIEKKGGYNFNRLIRITCDATNVRRINVL